MKTIGRNLRTLLAILLCLAKAYREGVHENITIENNKFINLKDSAVFADAVNGINIINNRFVNCCDNAKQRPDDYKAEVVLFNCNDIDNAENIDLAKREVSFIIR